MAGSSAWLVRVETGGPRFLREPPLGGSLRARFGWRFPQLRGKIDHAELSTPLSTAHFAGYPRGELYGLDHTPARFRMPIRVTTPVAGLYLTGQDLVTCGVSAALMGGVLTATGILGPRAMMAVMRR